MKKGTEMTEITRMSSKGQLVIPSDIREQMGLKEGSVLGISADNDVILLKKLDTNLDAKDLKTMKRLSEAWDDIEKGRFKSYSVDGFLKEIERMKESLE